MLRVTHGSYMRNCGRCFVTGSSQRNVPACTNRASTAAVIALVLEAILNKVSSSTAAPSPTANSPRVMRRTTLPSSITPTAIPGS
ncbi:hypothetical protein D3C81_1913020 [compost metagenome]